MAKAKKEVNEAPKAKTAKTEAPKAKTAKTEAPKAKTAKTEVPKADDVLKFSKKKFVESRRFAKRKDLVNALLDESKTYSIDEVEEIIKNFLCGKK